MHHRSVLSLLLSSVLLACGAADGAPPAQPPTPPQDATPTPDIVAASSEEITAQTPYGALVGTLEVPEAPRGMPVVVVFSGSGPQDRDGNTPGEETGPAMYRLLARSLVAEGIAVLRFDDPGVGASARAVPRSESRVTYDLEVEASGAMLPVVRRDARFGPIVVAGHSMGSLTAVLLAEKGDVDGVVSLAGAGRRVGALIREQLADRLTVDQRKTLDEVIASLERGEQVAPPAFPPLDTLFRTSVQPYMISWMRYDPAAEYAKLRIPALIVQGTTDVQVKVEDARALAAAKPDAELAIIENMCHPLKESTAMTGAEQDRQYSDPDLPLHPALVPALREFVRRVARAPGSAGSGQ